MPTVIPMLPAQSTVVFPEPGSTRRWLSHAFENVTYRINWWPIVRRDDVEDLFGISEVLQQVRRAGSRRSAAALRSLLRHRRWAARCESSELQRTPSTAAST